MCGIVGIFGRSGLSSEILQRMTLRLRHRGPDDQGLWLDSDAGVGLGHRRLSIVDLSPQGHQPMQSASGRFVLSYNGEIYNHADLRRELDLAKLSPMGGWRGHSDTETLVQAIAAWGMPRALDKCVGMFAFALWDKEERTLSLVRDRFGEKPLYYGWVGGDFLFGSELKAIQAHPRFANEIDQRALTAFVSQGFVPAPLSIYRRVFKLEPGCILEVDERALQYPLDRPIAPGSTQAGLRLSRYWSYADLVHSGLEQPIDTEEEALDQLEQALASAIRGQSVADVPVGAFLSGGIDSSTVVALYQKYSPTPVHSFTIGFHEPGFNEAEHAKRVAAHLGTIHHERYITVEEARSVIPSLPSIYDEPFADSSQIPTFLVSSFARGQVTVALSGDGGDELFGGYNRHVMAPALWSRLGKIPRPLRSAAGNVLGQIPLNLWNAALGRPNGDMAAKMRRGLRLAGSADSFDDLYSTFLNEWSLEASPLCEPSVAQHHSTGLMQHAPDAVRMMYGDAVCYLPDDVLCKVDRAAMAVSLETRVPFLDHRVAQVATRIPLPMKIRGRLGKRILRQLLSRELPPALFERPKTGFGIPIGDWLKGPLRQWAEDLLDPTVIGQEGWFNPEVVQRRWQQHLSGARPSAPALWAILMFQSWLREQRARTSMAA